ncbi:MAG: nuclear transport factor 2 family protein [Geminicoccaceae bacterium]
MTEAEAAINAAALVRQFYRCRRRGDPEGLRSLMAADVVWREPVVGDHMGELSGADAVIDMMSRAQSATGGSFILEVGETIATANGCAAVIEWRAEKTSGPINGRELAVFRFKAGLISEAWFIPEAIGDDQAFWA